MFIQLQHTTNNNNAASTTNPESGTIQYEYDDDGNLVKEIDPRKVTTSPLVYIETSFAYDALNRLISKSYNDSTPDVLYKYDRRI